MTFPRTCNPVICWSTAGPVRSVWSPRSSTSRPTSRPSCVPVAARWQTSKRSSVEPWKPGPPAHPGLPGCSQPTTLQWQVCWWYPPTLPRNGSPNCLRAANGSGSWGQPTSLLRTSHNPTSSKLPSPTPASHSHQFCMRAYEKRTSVNLTYWSSSDPPMKAWDLPSMTGFDARSRAAAEGRTPEVHGWRLGLPKLAREFSCYETPAPYARLRN